MNRGVALVKSSGGAEKSPPGVITTPRYRSWFPVRMSETRNGELLGQGITNCRLSTHCGRFVPYTLFAVSRTLLSIVDPSLPSRLCDMGGGHKLSRLQSAFDGCQFV